MPRDLPNILILLSDEHCGMAMSHVGDPNVRTAAMDRLASEGVSFPRAYANCPICVSSRGTIFSGRHAHAGPVSGFFDVYKATAPSTATILQESGYHTAYFGKWHCGTVRDQIPPEARAHLEEIGDHPHRTPEYHRTGFQDWYAFEGSRYFNVHYYHNNDIEPTQLQGYETDGLTDLVIGYLDRYNRDQPLCLVLSVTPPHFPLIVPDRWRHFDPDTIIVRENFNRPDPFFFSVEPEGDRDLRQKLARYSP